jgi:LruC domain-containing protein
VEGFAYPTEKSPISEAYLNFVNWAASNGTTHTGWFTNSPGNMNQAKIYQH